MIAVSQFHPHYDGRFASKTLPDHLRHPHLTLLMQTYLSFMRSVGAETWIMHGSLLGWWWNRKIMPWDSDVDVMISERSMRMLANYYNMTVHTYTLPKVGIEPGQGVTVVKEDGKPAAVVGDIKEEKPKAKWWPGGSMMLGGRDDEQEMETRKYLIEVNPHYANHSTTDNLNVIDARWIDVETGLFIDITTLHYEKNADATTREQIATHNKQLQESRARAMAEAKGLSPSAAAALKSSSSPDTETEARTTWLYSKDKHRYRESDIFPLRDSVFEDVTTKIPFAYSQLLEDEYGPRALTATKFMGHRFDQEQLMWIKDLPTP